LSPTGKARVAMGTIGGTAICILIALVVDSLNFSGFSDAQIRRAIAIDILLPLCVGGVFFYILLSKIRHLAIARIELEKIATTDSLTAVLNRGAFIMLVEAYLEKARSQTQLQQGSLLLIDADHFKGINDRHGHQTGDRALIQISETIRSNLRASDLVGRVGGEEFCIFLPATRPDDARIVAERIVQTIYQLPFPCEAAGERLSVSIGGVSFSRPASYEELFSIADRDLYKAKTNGRNRAILSTLSRFPGGA